VSVRSARTHARVGLIGNPSDGYGGAAIAFAFDALAAELSLVPSPDAFSIEWHGETVFRAASLAEALAAPPSKAASGAAALILAAGRQLMRAGGSLESNPCFAIRGESSIPLQAGLSGSSAIVVSALRLLAPSLGVAACGNEVAQLALQAETEELGINAGPMDRLAQVHGGLLFMDFGREHAEIQALEMPLPEGLYIAWDRSAGEASGRVHGNLRKRFEAGEPAVREAMGQFRELAIAGRESLLAADDARLRSLLDTNFDLRRDVVGVSERDQVLVAIGRRHGAGVKLSGSGGAVVGLATEARLPAIRDAYEAAGHGWLRPRLVPGGGAIPASEASSPP
jgi:glucuronokinase